MRASRISTAMSLGLGLVACGGSADESVPAKGVSLATFNVGLASGYEQNVAERKVAIQSVLAAKAKDLDLLCVQEYWDESHWNDLVAATASELPNALRRPAEPGPTSCSKTELDPLIACIQDKCASSLGQGLASCAIANCGSSVSALGPASTACVTKDLSQPLSQIYDTCTAGAAGGGNANDTPAIFGGVFDVGLLSRYPFLEQDSKRLDAFMVRVAVLYAKVATDAGDLNVFCTHLTSGIGDWAYGGTHESWEKENAFEAQQLVDYVNEKTKGGGTAVILGDLNSGPALGSSIEADWPESFGQLTNAGLTDPFALQSDVSCSLCPDNTQRGPDSSPELADHVLIRDFSGKALVERLFTEPVTIEVQGAPVSTSLSDHYGLEATLRR